MAARPQNGRFLQNRSPKRKTVLSGPVCPVFSGMEQAHLWFRWVATSPRENWLVL